MAIVDAAWVRDGTIRDGNQRGRLTVERVGVNPDTPDEDFSVEVIEVKRLGR